MAYALVASLRAHHVRGPDHEVVNLFVDVGDWRIEHARVVIIR